jgi:histidine phosphotransfer protein HptB
MTTHSASATGASAARTAPATVDLAPLAHLREACPPGNGPTSLTAVVGLFLDLSVERLAGLHRALEAGDAETLRTLAHAVKGSGGLFGATRLSGLGAELEAAAGRDALDEAAVLVRLVGAEMAAVEAVLVREVGPDR